MKKLELTLLSDASNIAEALDVLRQQLDAHDKLDVDRYKRMAETVTLTRTEPGITFTLRFGGEK